MKMTQGQELKSGWELAEMRQEIYELGEWEWVQINPSSQQGQCISPVSKLNEWFQFDWQQYVSEAELREALQLDPDVAISDLDAFTVMSYVAFSQLEKEKEKR